MLYSLDAFDVACLPHAQRAASAVVAADAFIHLYDCQSTSRAGRARLLDGSVPRGPFSFWHRVPVSPVDPDDDVPPLFALPDGGAFPAALAFDLLLRPPLDTHLTSEAVECRGCRGRHVADPAIGGSALTIRHFVDCPNGIRCPSRVHDPLVRLLTCILDAIFGPAHVLAERSASRRQVTEFMATHPLPHRPDIVIEGFDGPGTYLIIEVRTFDAASPSALTLGTDRHRLAGHRAKERAAQDDYGVLPARMRLLPFVVSTFGSFGPSARWLVQRLDRRCGSSIPLSLLPHASWAAPRLAPFIRMAVGCSIRRGTAMYHLEMWDDASMRAASRDITLDRCGLAVDDD